jgi:hypothetical protein
MRHSLQIKFTSKIVANMPAKKMQKTVRLAELRSRPVFYYQGI